jgi:predicted nuclease with TOPRIM domain
MRGETSSYVSARIEAIQQELEQLKRALSRLIEGKKRKTKLKGLWKGVEVTEEEIEEAKRAVFKDAYEFEGK